MRSLRSTSAATLIVLVASTGFADDSEKQNRPKREARELGAQIEDRPSEPAALDSVLARPRVLSESGVVAQGFSGSSGIQMELFARAGLSLLNVTAEESLGLPAPTPDDALSLSASRLVSEFGWGAGARLRSGQWGIEGSYSIFESLSLSPGWLVADAEGVEATTAVLDLPLAASRAGVLVGQIVRTFPMSGGRTELFLGLGAGWMRVTDSSTDRLLSGLSVPAPDEIAGGQLPPDIPLDFLEALTPELEFTADRDSVVVAGSLGLSFRVGRILVRPRLDVIIPRALTTELTLGFPGLADIAPPGEDLGALEIHYKTSVTPRIFLLSVDIGLGN